MPGNATRRMLQRSIIFPRTGTAMAPRIPPTDNAKDVVLRIHPVSAMIGLRNTPNVKPRTGPLQTNKPVTAPTTTHQGLVNFSPMTVSRRATAFRPRSVAAISRAGQRCRASAGPFSKDRTFSSNPLLAGFELPASELVASTGLLPGSGGAPDRLGAGFHRRRFGRAFEQTLALRRPIRSQIGIARFVAYRDDHTGAARGLCGGVVTATLKTAIEAEPRPGVGELAAATAIGHSTTIDPASIRETIGRISVGGRCSSRRIARLPEPAAKGSPMSFATRDPGTGNRR